MFADVSRDSQSVTAETVAEKITPNTRAILAVHLAAGRHRAHPAHTHAGVEGGAPGQYRAHLAGGA
ncbi:DegT/DnrJ/EryC1/StrS family aminotransferase [Aquisalimonas sp.]|uniref:DegT/DnrJ/EryC1/StrS family aminotransferase n=1 Tax=Aquisalimonas sp. TaxID=1872621 RepID=UPI0034518201